MCVSRKYAIGMSLYRVDNHLLTALSTCLMYNARGLVDGTARLFRIPQALSQAAALAVVALLYWERALLEAWCRPG
jgi:hypothetical protein